jgi:hypothetical protein
MRKLAAASSACSAALLALVVFLDVTHAGRAYVYCTSMQEVMQHACCKQQHASSSTSAATISTSESDCCQNHVVPSLGSWTSLSRPLFVAAPLLAVVARWPVELLRADLTRVGIENPLIRSGPPLLRVLAQLMVFRL